MIRLRTGRSSLLLGVGNYLFPVAVPIWKQAIAGQARRLAQEQGFMSSEHHRLHNLVVSELPRQDQPLTPAWLADQLEQDLDQVWVMLDEMERHLLYLVRNSNGAVTWAYPFTVAQTPHHLKFSSGERAYAA